jgi:hypothetical protein
VSGDEEPGMIDGIPAASTVALFPADTKLVQACGRTTAHSVDGGDPEAGADECKPGGT